MDYTRNADGTITLIVDGVWPDYNSTARLQTGFGAAAEGWKLQVSVQFHRGKGTGNTGFRLINPVS
ncbi:MAG: hypothetical protein ACLUOI_14745 [Eisenbergiella sp.]